MLEPRHLKDVDPSLGACHREVAGILYGSNGPDLPLVFDGKLAVRGDVSLDVMGRPDVDYTIPAARCEKVLGVIGDGETIDWVLVLVQGRYQPAGWPPIAKPVVLRAQGVL